MTESIAQMDGLLAWARRKSACGEAIDWLKTQDSPEAAWAACERPDWMIWMARKRGIDRKALVRIACECARTALRFVPEGEDRPRLAIEAAERWIVGEATIQEVRTARDAAADAAADAYAAADAADAAAAAADAADAAYAAAYAYAAAAADAAADAAAAADADAADAAAYAYARRAANIKMADIVREQIPFNAIWTED